MERKYNTLDHLEHILTSNPESQGTIKIIQGNKELSDLTYSEGKIDKMPALRPYFFTYVDKVDREDHGHSVHYVINLNNQ